MHISWNVCIYLFVSTTCVGIISSRGCGTRHLAGTSPAGFPRCWSRTRWILTWCVVIHRPLTAWAETLLSGARAAWWHPGPDGKTFVVGWCWMFGCEGNSHPVVPDNLNSRLQGACSGGDFAGAIQALLKRMFFPLHWKRNEMSTQIRSNQYESRLTWW